MPIDESIEDEYWQYLTRAIGRGIIMEACSSALYALCKKKPPKNWYSKYHWRYKQSREALAFIQSGGLTEIVECYGVDIDIEKLENMFFNFAKKVWYKHHHEGRFPKRTSKIKNNDGFKTIYTTVSS